MISACRNVPRKKVFDCKKLYLKDVKNARLALADTARNVLQVGRLHNAVHSIEDDPPLFVWRRGLNACVHLSPWGNREADEPAAEWHDWAMQANAMMWRTGQDLALGLEKVAAPADVVYGLAVAGLDHLVEDVMGVGHIRKDTFHAANAVHRGWSDMDGYQSVNATLQMCREQLLFDLASV